MFSRSRLNVQRMLGLFWTVDGLLQLKPQMFTNAFVHDVILPTAQGQPTWIAALVNWGAHVVLSNVGVWNGFFAVIQLTLGVALMFNVRPRATLGASILWSAVVWGFGEGFGQVLTGQSLFLTGAPGAAMLYGLLGVAVWPSDSVNVHEWRLASVKFARYALGALWIAGALMHLQHAYLSAGKFSDAISVPWLASWVAVDSRVVSLLIALLELALGIAFLLGRRVRVAAWTTVALALLFWWVGQSFGQVFEPLSTDLNSGPLLALLAICALPIAQMSHAPRRPVFGRWLHQLAG